MTRLTSKIWAVVCSAPTRVVGICAAPLMTLLVPATLLGTNVGDCIDGARPVEWEFVTKHLCMQGIDGCPEPYSVCVLIGPPTGCPNKCKYRWKLASARGSYCYFTDEDTDSCRHCPGEFVCERYGIYEDKTCKTHCGVLGCRQGCRTEQGLCDPGP